MTTSRRTVAALAAVSLTALTVAGCSSHQSTGTNTPTAQASQSASATPTPSPTPTETSTPSPSASPSQSTSATPSSTAITIPTATATQTPLPYGRKGTPRGAKTSLPARIDLAKADDVAEAFVISNELWDTRIDNRPNDASRRAAAYATPAYRKKLLHGAPVAPPDNSWTQLADHNGYTTVTVRLGGMGAPPPDTHTTATRAVNVHTQTMHGDHGWTTTGPDDGLIYLITMHRTSPGHPWGVSKLSLMQ